MHPHSILRPSRGPPGSPRSRIRVVDEVSGYILVMTIYGSMFYVVSSRIAALRADVDWNPPSSHFPDSGWKATFTPAESHERGRPRAILWFILHFFMLLGHICSPFAVDGTAIGAAALLSILPQLLPPGVYNHPVVGILLYTGYLDFCLWFQTLWKRVESMSSMTVFAIVMYLSAGICALTTIWSIEFNAEDDFTLRDGFLRGMNQMLSMMENMLVAVVNHIALKCL